MNQERINRVIYLQAKANRQIAMYGQCSEDVFDEMIMIIDMLTPEEQDAVLESFENTLDHMVDSFVAQAFRLN